MPNRKVVVMTTSSPFATLNSYEALRLSLGLFDVKVSVLWSGEGVYNAIKGGDNTLIQPFIRVLPDLDIDLYVDKSDLREKGLTEAELIRDVKAIEREDVIQLICEADIVLTF
jgi:sulfur relay (sulfurtransferase) DsrF/TusC family protein